MFAPKSKQQPGVVTGSLHTQGTEGRAQGLPLAPEILSQEEAAAQTGVASALDLCDHEAKNLS